MKTKVNIFTTDWCEMVFEGKNKNYGAYALRVESGRQKLKALFLAVVLAGSVAIFPIISKKLLPPINNERNTTETTLTSIDDFPTPPEEIEIPRPVPRPMVMFTPPVIVNGKVNKDEMPQQDDLKMNTSVIGFKNIAGDPNSQYLPDVDFTPIDENKDKVWDYVEKQPQFPELTEYLNKNLRYPTLAAEMGISGKVFVEFIVGKNGEITDAKVIRGIGGGCDEEALRVVKAMPNWHPGIQNGLYVKVKCMLPVTFKLQQQ